ncbi:amino acid ABC transporter permease [Butyrivibrio sp. VCB2006]|uniref:amino acid ABC transporter permease n=1 Tax=Butyrivibrio sp. VCB2006 TaxID=1280679 RepID=UPI000412A071|nr:amino acid ABC transporter permease [Butyrivibrio sp. VCB2006]
MNVDWKFVIEAFPQVLAYLPVTIELTVVAMTISLIIGTIFAYINFKKVKVASQIIRTYMSLIRGTPIVLQIFVIFHFGPYLLTEMFQKLNIQADVYSINPIYYAFLALSLSTTVSIAEAVRAGLESIDKGQFESGLSVGMTEGQVLFNVVFPQAFTTAWPVLGNILVGLIKSSSLAFMLSVVEITGYARILGGGVLRYFESYICVFFIYIVVIKISELIMKKLEETKLVYRRRQC